ncbi:DUF427-domain-containing protein [Heliocybe sulcata]|uniref:DUF427-domain-containing protein n=1 Tax=Heliocybe sulcata TaxID=5364 RepID=A0A5C3N1N4_9AGAM|nr:DUF427-domain-containing protein [Heliocybe sulcata]
MPPSFVTNGSLPYVETSPKRVRVFFNDTCIADSRAAKLVWEHGHYPQYYFPAAAISSMYLEQGKEAGLYDVVVGNERAEGAATKPASGPLEGLVKIAPGTQKGAFKWLEEEWELKGHPRDPYKRVDVLPSSRHVRVEVDGVEVANSHQPRLLFETHLITRYYIPRSDIRADLLEESQLTTYCPYKGTASYFNVKLPSGKTVENIVWYYPKPYPECSDVEGCVAFYDEKVDVWVDGEKVPRPETPFRNVSA